MRTLLPLLASLVALTSASPARAADPAGAQSLFEDGKRLMAQGQYALACARFEESNREDPGIGTLFHVAECHERVGKTASAWAEYLEVAADAKAHGQAARETAARQKAAALESKVPRLTLDPGAAAATPSLELYRDGELLGRAQWGTAMPVDPGDHKLEARAPDKGTWSVSENVPVGGRVVVTVPLLADAPAPQAQPVASFTTTSAAEVPAGSSGTGQRVAGVLIGVAGLAGIGTGTYFGLTSKSRHDDAAAHCTGNLCDARGVTLRSEARQAGDASTVAFVAGGTALLGGIIVFATAPNRRAPYAPQVAVGPGAVMLRGEW